MREQILIDEIKTILKAGCPVHEVQRLGGEYITVFNKVSQRLLRCVDLIRQGKHSIALQEAQFSPPLMKTLDSIVFARAAEWHEILKANGYNPPSDLDSEHISLMRDLYTKPISGSDPLYQDLAHAMRTKNFEHALLVLRIIREKNPSDSNAIDQVAKIEARIQGEKLKTLVQLARDEEEDGFSDMMGFFINEPWENKPKGTKWEESVVYHDKLQRKRSLVHCKQMIESLIQLKKDNNSEEAQALLNSIRNLQNEQKFILDEEIPGTEEKTYSAVLTESEEWSENEYRKRVRETEDKERLFKLKSIIRKIQDKEVGKKSKVPEMRNDLGELTSIARDLQEAKQSLEPEDLASFNKTLSKLRGDIAKKHRAFRFLVAGLCIALLAVSIPSLLHFAEKNKRESELAMLVDGVERYTNSEELNTFITTFQKTHPERKDEAEFKIEIEKAKMWVNEARAENEKFTDQLRDIERELKITNDFAKLRSLQNRKSLQRENLINLNQAFVDEQKERILKIDLIWNEKRNFIQSEIAQEIFQAVDVANEFGSSQLKIDLAPLELEQNLRELNGMLLVLESEISKYEGLDGVGLSVGQVDIVSGLRTLYLKRKNLLIQYNSVLAGIESAESLPGLLKVYKDLMDTELVGSSVYQSVKAVLLLQSQFSDTSSKVFFPTSLTMWDEVGSQISSDYQDDVLDLEMEPLRKLYGDKRIQNVFSNTVYRSEIDKRFSPQGDSDLWDIKDKKTPKEVIWTVGDLIEHKLEFKSGSGSGSYEVKQFANVIRGIKIQEETFISEWRGISRSFKKIDNIVMAKGEIVVGGKLNPGRSKISTETKYLYDESSPLVQLFSPPQLNHPHLKFLDSLKSQNIDPFIKSLVFIRIMETMEARPEKWGLKNDPFGKLSISEDFLKLRNITSGLDLVAEWYRFLSTNQETPKRKELISFFNNAASISYWKEVKFLEKFWKTLLSSTFDFIGYAKEEGVIETKLEGAVWGLSITDQKLRLLSDGEILQNSPLLRLSIGLQYTLEEARLFAGMTGVEEKVYQKIKQNLPYPFNQVAEK